MPRLGAFIEIIKALPRARARAFGALSIVLAAFLCAPAARAATPAFGTVQVEQCDGTWGSAVTTSTGVARVRVAMREATAGLRVDTNLDSPLDANTLYLYRADQYKSVYYNSASPCGSNEQCYFFYIDDAKNNEDLFAGDCRYNDVGGKLSSLYWEPSIDVDNGSVSITSGCPTTTGGIDAGPTNFFNASPFSAAVDSLRLDFESTGVFPFERANFVITNDAQMANLGSAFTFSAWINKDDLSGTEYIATRYKSWLLRFSGSTLQAYVDTTDDDTANYSSAMNLGTWPGAGAWHKLVVTWDGTTMRSYVDGAALASVNASQTGAVANSQENITLGGYQTAPTTFSSSELDGNMDEIRFLSRVMSADQVKFDYDGTRHYQQLQIDGPDGEQNASGAGVLSGSGSTAHGTTDEVTYTIGPFDFAGSNNYFQFYAMSLGGELGATGLQQVVTNFTPPGTPSGFAATTDSTSQITWSWSANGQMCTDGEYVFKRVSGFSGETVRTQTQPNLTISGLNPNTMYTATVRAHNIHGTSSESAERGNYTLANAPTGVGVTRLGARDVRVAWNANSNPTYTPYEVTISSGGGSQFTLGTNISTPVAFSQTSPFTPTTTDFYGLPASATFYVRVRAMNGDGSFEAQSSSGGGVSTAFAPSASGGVFYTDPLAPPGVSGTADSTDQITWTWNHVPTVQSYTVLDEDSSVLQASVTGARSYTRGPGLTQNTRYGIMLAATNGAGTTTTAATYYAYTDAAPPSAPAVLGRSSSSVGITWSGGSNPGYTIYQVAVATNPAFAATISTKALSGLEATFYGLLPGVTYYARVRALSGSGVPTAFTAGVSTITTVLSDVTRYPAPAAALDSQRRDHGMAALDDGGLLVVGGWDPGVGAPVDSVRRYDPDSGLFQARAALPRRLSNAAVLRLADGRIFVHGGRTDPAQEPSEVSSMTYLYNVAGDSWTVAAAGGDRRFDHAALVLDDKRVLTCGGQSSVAGGTLATCRIYDPGTNAWCGGTVGMGSSRTRFTLTRVGTGRILAAGGHDGANALASTELTSPNTSCPGSTWSAGPAMANERDGHTATLLGNGRVLLLGGRDSVPTVELSSTSSVFNPIGDTMTPGPVLAGGRYRHTATLLSGGDLLVAGGWEADGASPSLDVARLSETGGTTTYADALVYPRARHTAAELSDGRLLLVGGDIQSAEIFNLPLGASGAGAMFTVSDFLGEAQVEFPPGTLPPDVDVFISMNPKSNPVFADPTALVQGLSTIPAGLDEVAGTMREFVISKDGVYWTATFASSPTIRIRYEDDEGDGIVDETTPPILASQLRMYTFNTITAAWEEVPDIALDSANRWISAPVSHFSVYGLFADSSIAPTISSVRAYPVPWRPGRADRYGDAAYGGKTGLVFSGLPARAIIRIFNLVGEKVRELSVEAADGGSKVWDGRNDFGHPVGSGLYFAHVRLPDRPKERALLKVVIER